MNTKSLMTGGAAAALLIAAALGLKVAEHSQLIAPVTGARSFQVMIGLGLAFYANFIPKTLGAMRNPASASRRQAALRVAGWSFTVAGLAYAGLSAFAPTELSDLLSMLIMGSAVAITLIYAAACVLGAAGTSKGSAG